MIFENLTDSSQDLSKEGLNFILSSLFRSWSLNCLNIGIFLTNYQKLKIMASIYNLRTGQDSEFAKLKVHELSFSLIFIIFSNIPS